MKAFIISLAIAISLVSLTSCGGSEKPTKEHFIKGRYVTAYVYTGKYANKLRVFVADSLHVGDTLGCVVIISEK